MDGENAEKRLRLFNKVKYKKLKGWRQMRTASIELENIRRNQGD